MQIVFDFKCTKDAVFRENVEISKDFGGLAPISLWRLGLHSQIPVCDVSKSILSFKQSTIPPLTSFLENQLFISVKLSAEVRELKLSTAKRSSLIRNFIT